MLVCEDAWHSLTGTIAALDGAQVVFVSSAAPARGMWPRHDGVPGPASVARWERLVRDIAEEHGVYVGVREPRRQRGRQELRRQLVGRAGRRATCACAPPCATRRSCRSRVDLGDLTRARADSPLLNDLRVAMPHLLRMLDAVQRREPVVLSYDPAAPPRATHGLMRADERASGASDVAGGAGSGRGTPDVGSPGARQSPSVPDADEPAGDTDGAGPPRDTGYRSDRPTPAPRRRTDDPHLRVPLADHGLPPALDIDAPLLERWLVGFLRDELARRGFRKAIVGLSGGVDSAVTTFLAARALGAENVVAVRMPYRTSSPESLAHAQLVIDALGDRDAAPSTSRRRSTAISRWSPTPIRRAAATSWPACA